MENNDKKAWGGRFAEDTADLALKLSESISYDRRLARQDIRGSRAHARMLAARGIISAKDGETIQSGFDQLEKELAEGNVTWDVTKEDVHMNLESRLTAIIGDAGGRLHTARSRNDQVATDTRLWLRDACAQTVGAIHHLQSALHRRAQENVDVLLPGYTHLQRAQPVRLAHHLLAWVEMLERDRGRISDAVQRFNQCPLGSGALAGTTFPIDREQTSKELGFREPTQNSMDTVADRDFIAEVLSAWSICAIHLSRFSEELVLWCSQEFGFVKMSDAYATGSSMMPQKKNPDMAELIRGKSGRVVGALVSILTVMKGLPLTYNRDMQEDKEGLFDGFDTVLLSLQVMAGMVATLSFQEEPMARALKEGFADATEIADWLAERGMPFRDAHHVVGRLVARCTREQKVLAELSLEELQQEHAGFDDTVYEVLNMERAVERRDHVGGPARAQVQAQLQRWQTLLEGRANALTPTDPI